MLRTSPVPNRLLVQRPQILGWAAFYGMRISVQPDVFVPRLRTELLVRPVASVAWGPI